MARDAAPVSVHARMKGDAAPPTGADTPAGPAIRDDQIPDAAAAVVSRRPHWRGLLSLV